MVNKCCFEYESQGPSLFWWRIMAVALFYLANNFSPTFPYDKDDNTSAPDNTWAWMKTKDYFSSYRWTFVHALKQWPRFCWGTVHFATVCVYNYKQEIGSTNMNMFPFQPYRISYQHQNIENWQRHLNLADPYFTFDV